MTNLNELTPDIKVSINQTFGIDTDMQVDAFSKKNNVDRNKLRMADIIGFYLNLLSI